MRKLRRNALWWAVMFCVLVLLFAVASRNIQEFFLMTLIAAVPFALAVVIAGASKWAARIRWAFRKEQYGIWAPILFVAVLFGVLLFSYYEEEGIWGLVKVLFVSVLACGYAYIMFSAFNEDVDKAQGVDANSLLWRDFNREQRARKEIERLSEDE